MIPILFPGLIKHTLTGARLRFELLDRVHQNVTTVLKASDGYTRANVGHPHDPINSLDVELSSRSFQIPILSEVDPGPESPNQQILMVADKHSSRWVPLFQIRARDRSSGVTPDRIVMGKIEASSLAIKRANSVLASRHNEAVIVNSQWLSSRATSQLAALHLRPIPAVHCRRQSRVCYCVQYSRIIGRLGIKVWPVPLHFLHWLLLGWPSSLSTVYMSGR